MVTKWDLISDAERAALDAQPFTQWYVTDDGEELRRPGRCSGCGELVATEGAFARHYVLTDTRYLNLGYCPNKGRAGVADGGR